MPAPFSEVHLFVDESGRFDSNDRGDPSLVGGVLVFGPYDDPGLLGILQARWQAAGGAFPAELHASTSRLYEPRWDPLFDSLRSDLAAWCGDRREIHGVALVHVEDRYAGGAALLAEREADNRYLGMVGALIEHLLFIRPEVVTRLAPGVVLNLHVARRVFVFDPERVSVESLADWGFRVQDDRHASGLKRVFGVLNERDLVAQLRELWRRWRVSTIQLGPVHVDDLDYSGARSAAGLYLADLYLGQARSVALATRRRGVRVRPAWLPVLCHSGYGPWLDLLAGRRAALNAGDAAGYLRLTAEDATLPAECAELDTALETDAVHLLAADPIPLERAAEDAARRVDEPGGSTAGGRLADRCVRLLLRLPTPAPRGELLALRALLSAANHTGQVGVAEETWARYLEREPSFRALGLEFVQHRFEMHNRRAVALTDQFRRGEAIALLRSLVLEQTDLGRQFGNQAVARSLAACLGTLGQVLCFEGDDHIEAEACFRRAEALFDLPEDRERQWVYLGHLAIERGVAGFALWQEVGGHLSGLLDPVPVTGDRRQFVLALQLKGVLTFGTPAERSRYLTAWQQTNPLETFAAEARRHHPFGLIHQAVAMLVARLWREGRDPALAAVAKDSYRIAAEQMGAGGPLLALLGAGTRLRAALFDRASVPATDREILARIFANFRAHATYHFGVAAWGEDADGRSTGCFGKLDPGLARPLADRAAAILTGLRFNYW